MYRRSLAQLLLNWSVLMLGLITSGLGYLLLQLQLEQFSSGWERRITFELDNLARDVEYHLESDNRYRIESRITERLTDSSVRYLAVLTEAGDQVIFSTRSADLVQGLSYRLSSHSLNTGIREAQIERHQSEFYALFPLRLSLPDDPSVTRSSSPKGWLFAHYDAAQDYDEMLRALVRKIMLVAVLIVVFLVVQSQILRRYVLLPVKRLIHLTTSMMEGKYASISDSRSAKEIAKLEKAFNELSHHLDDTTHRIAHQQALTDAFTSGFPDIGLLVTGTGVINGRFGNPQSRISRLNEDLTGTPFTAWLNLSATETIERARNQALNTRELVIAEFSHDDLFLESRMVPLEEGTGEENALIWLIRDISEIKRKQQLIEYQANYDPLTDLANRRMALQQLESKICQTQEDGGYSGVLFIDLDHFKNINDSLGHPIGDRLLIEAARRLTDCVKRKDIIARLGGDEFLIILDKAEDTEQQAENMAIALGEQILDAIRQPFSIDINKFHLTASIGIAIFPTSECGANDLIRQADTAMYWAKHQGRSQLCLYNHRMQEETRERLHLFNDLYQAIRDNGFTLVYQPQHNDSGEITGAEALCRWVNNGQSVYPDVFIAAAEETNLILPLGEWVLTHACRTLRQWIKDDSLPASFKRLAVNISPAQFMDPDFEQKLDDTLALCDIDSSVLELELTESLFMGDKDLIREKMQRLSAKGFTFALDDFGTGYSSLSYLQKLPINKLKIDRAFVMDIQPGSERASIVDAIIQLGQNLNMDIIAEGVETDQQQDYLQQHGCRQYQGYFFSRPLRDDMFVRYINDNPQ
ncbi:MAG: EAL domain-containing protein [Pseudomonadota bacterium]|jgi:diguanylate cyclase (GGDEF)-like protein|nr:EAL domain-containing protein [Pseudomonadota bacterium]